VSDHYPALAFQARQFLKTKVTTSMQPPLVTDVFAVDVFAEMLDRPLHFLNYLALRARFEDKLIVSHELTSLGFHLKHNLWLEPKYTMVSLGDGFTSALDIAMQARRAGVPGERTPKGILTRFDGLTIGRLLSEIEKIGSPQLTGLGLLLLQLSSEAAKSLSKGIDGIVRHIRRDSKSHDLSVPISTAGSGITIHCNGLPEDVGRERLLAHCRMRKYDAKANAWYGLLLDPATSGIRGALVIEGDWKPDPHMDAAIAAWPKRPPVPISQLASGRRKIGRNEPCPCSSGRKYKKCCLNA
jgi:SEC-C motif